MILTMPILKMCVLVILACCLCVLCVLLIECVRIVYRARKMVDRLTLLTDFREWFSLINKFRSCRKKAD